jgi:hypothetical protein
MNIANHQTLKAPSGDPIIDMLACVWAAAFAEAESGDHQARQELVANFGLEKLLNLWRQGFISWNPWAVHVQLTLEV